MSPIDRTSYYRTELEGYADTWSEFLAMRREDGILEVRLHTDDGPALWGVSFHRALIPAFADIWADPENECVIITGSGDSFLDRGDAEDRARYAIREEYTFSKGYDYWYRDQTHEPFALLNLDVPVISAINGPITTHQELALLNDLVICTPETTIADNHLVGGIVPGDGVVALFRELLGPIRANHFVLTGEAIGANELLQRGLVGEVVPQDQLLDRAWTLAREVFMAKDRAHRRMTRALLVQPWREKLIRELPFGMALEGWAMHGRDGVASLATASATPARGA